MELGYPNPIQAFESGRKGLWNQVLLINVNLLYGSFNQVYQQKIILFGIKTLKHSMEILTHVQ